MTKETDFERFVSYVEKVITRKLVDRIFDLPGTVAVEVNDGEETTGKLHSKSEVFNELGSTCENWIKIYLDGEYIGGVWLVWGNGSDLIDDYSTTLVDWIEPLLNEIEKEF